MALDNFHPAVAAWFRARVRSTDAGPARAWPAIQSGRHALIAAPTGSGKTLAAFLAAIDDLVRRGIEQPAAGRDQRRLCFAAEGAVQRHPDQSGSAAGGHSRRTDAPGPAGRRDPHRRAHRRYAAIRARSDAPAAAAHRRDDAGVAVHPARLGIRPDHAGRRRARSSSTKSTRWHRTSAARTWRCRWSACEALCAAATDAHRPVGDAEADRAKSRGSWSAAVAAPLPHRPDGGEGWVRGQRAGNHRQG